MKDRKNTYRILKLMKFLRDHAGSFFAEEKTSGRTVNYEDIFYLVSQLADAAREYENPGISHLLKRVKRDFVAPQLPAASSFGSNDLLNETRKYMKCAVAGLLSRQFPKPDHLRTLVDASKDDELSKMHVCSLNHDLLIERVFDESGVEYDDGFEPEGFNLSSWNRELLPRSGRKVCLLKLHGSVDWFPVRMNGCLGNKVCKCSPGVVDQALDRNGSPVTTLSGGPEILVGTFNKMLEYSSGIYADIFAAFRCALWQFDALVVSGYSFGDKGINASIAEWIREDSGRRMMVISPDADRYAETARGAIRRVFAQCDRRISIEIRGFETVEWSTIKAFCKAS